MEVTFRVLGTKKKKKKKLQIGTFTFRKDAFRCFRVYSKIMQKLFTDEFARL